MNDIIEQNEEIIKKKMYCLNCGKKGHICKKCKDPPTSYGLICFKIAGDWQIYQNILQIKYYKINHYNQINNINMYWFNNKNKDIKDDINYYIDKIKKDIRFLLIRRKHSLGYIEFIRGRYDINNIQTITHLIEQMTEEEKNNILNNNLEILWDNLWRNTSRSKLYEKEYIKSVDKFNYLKDKMLNIIKDTKPKYDIPEWGFPKGRRNYLEKDLECAKREFMEESGMKEDEFVILDRIYPLNETFFGTNQIKYKHTYYISISNSNRKLEISDDNIQIQEIGDIGWFNYEELLLLIRPYHIERLKIVEDLIYFIAFNTKYYQENNTIRTLKLM